MSTFKFSFLILASLFLITSCGDDDEMHNDDNDKVEYSINILAPTTDDKRVGEDLTINIEFESKDEETVHHVNVRIYNKVDETLEIYNGPADAHVHETSGSFTFNQTLSLIEDSGVEGHTDWILEAKVWGHEAGLAEVIETIEFHVHPE